VADPPLTFGLPHERDLLPKSARGPLLGQSNVTGAVAKGHLFVRGVTSEHA
jgi:hypothetical protein